MIRTKQHKGLVTAILTADWHLREDTPVCRTDDFWDAQWRKVKFVSDLQLEYNCVVFHAGDLFDFWKPSPHLLSMAIQYLPKQFYTVYGNHDLPQHNIDLAHKSGVHTLWKAQILEFLDDFSIGDREVKMVHQYAYVGTPPFPGAKNPAHAVMQKYNEFDLILTGDNHQAFVVQHEGRLLVNPGSLTRQDASQIDFEPRVYLWYAESNTVEPVYLPIDKNAVSREHIDRQQQRDGRIQAFISRLDGEWKAELSFEENLERFRQANDVRDDVMEIIYKAIA